MRTVDAFVWRFSTRELHLTTNDWTKVSWAQESWFLQRNSKSSTLFCIITSGCCCWWNGLGDIVSTHPLYMTKVSLSVLTIPYHLETPVDHLSAEWCAMWQGFHLEHIGDLTEFTATRFQSVRDSLMWWHRKLTSCHLTNLLWSNIRQNVLDVLAILCIVF